jgi:hypothetical protein
VLHKKGKTKREEEGGRERKERGRMRGSTKNRNRNVHYLHRGNCTLTENTTFQIQTTPSTWYMCVCNCTEKKRNCIGKALFYFLFIKGG